MPEGLDGSLTKSELTDLLAFLQAERTAPTQARRMRGPGAAWHPSVRDDRDCLDLNQQTSRQARLHERGSWRPLHIEVAGPHSP